MDKQFNAFIGVVRDGVCVCVFVASQRPATPPFLRKLNRDKQVAGKEPKGGVSKSSVRQDKTPHLGDKELARSTSDATAGSTRQSAKPEQMDSGEGDPLKPDSGGDAKPASPAVLTARDIFGDSDGDENVEMADEWIDVHVGQLKSPQHT